MYWLVEVQLVQFVISVAEDTTKSRSHNVLPFRELKFHHMLPFDSHLTQKRSSRRRYSPLVWNWFFWEAIGEELWFNFLMAFIIRVVRKSLFFIVYSNLYAWFEVLNFFFMFCKLSTFFPLLAFLSILLVLHFPLCPWFIYIRVLLREKILLFLPGLAFV